MCVLVIESGRAWPVARRTLARVGQNRIYTPYMTVCLVISLCQKHHVHDIIYIYVWCSGLNVGEVLWGSRHVCVCVREREIEREREELKFLCVCVCEREGLQVFLLQTHDMYPHPPLGRPHSSLATQNRSTWP